MQQPNIQSLSCRGARPSRSHDGASRAVEIRQRDADESGRDARAPNFSNPAIAGEKKVPTTGKINDIFSNGWNFYEKPSPVSSPLKRERTNSDQKTRPQGIGALHITKESLFLGGPHSREAAPNPRAGQALIESAIGLALLSITFAIIAVVSYMTVQRTRTAMAARHAAWLGGHGVGSAAVVEYSVERGFFYESNLVHVAANPPIVGPDPQVNAASAQGFVEGFIGEALGNSVGKSSYRIAYGIQADTPADDIPFPLKYFDLTFPISGESVGEGGLQEASQLFFTDCHWDEVSDAWQCLGNMVEDLIGGVDFEDLAPW